MPIRNLRPLGAVVLGCAVALLIPAPAAAGTKGADVRVLAHTGKVLAEYRQYTGTTGITTSRRADCFGERGSSRRYRLRGANALGLLVDAKAHDLDLHPLRVTDAFFDDFGSLGVCQIARFKGTAQSYWYLGHNHAAASGGANQERLRNGDDVVWFFTPPRLSDFPSELRLSAPARIRPGVPFEVRVVRFAPDGSRSPAQGVRVTNGLGPTNAEGKTRVTIPAEGRKALRARGEADDIPSNRVSVCVNSRLAKCPGRHGKLIFGSGKPDGIKGTPGWDRIRAGRGDDVVDLRKGGRDRVDCGPGRDTVVLERSERPDRNDRLRRCERVVRR